MINPVQLVQMLQSGGNGPQAIIGMLRQQAGNNPVMRNALDMIERNDAAGIEQLARNLCRERGINPEEAVKQLMNGMK